jgi:tetratricopeptide (TPR) repeat protein
LLPALRTVLFKPFAAGESSFPFHQESERPVYSVDREQRIYEDAASFLFTFTNRIFCTVSLLIRKKSMKKTIQKAQGSKEVSNKGHRNAPRSGTRFLSLEKVRPIYLYAFLVGIILIIYSQTFSFRYTGLDDESLISENYKKLSDPSQIGKALFLDVGLQTDKAMFYRPVQSISFILDTLVGGAHPSVYHISNVLLHCAMCCSVLYLFLTLGFRIILALLFAALFAVHPVFVHAICWIPSRGDMLIGLFLLWSFVFYHRYDEWKHRMDFILHHVFFLFAVFSKETAVVFPLLIILYVIFLHRKKKIIVDLLPSLVVWLPVLCIWFFLRKSAIIASIDPKLAGIGPLFHNLPAIPESISKLFLPAGISAMPAFSLFGGVSGVVIIILLFVWAFVVKRWKETYFLFGLIWFTLFLLPSLWYRNPLGGNAYDYLTHRLYLPAVGLLLAVITLLRTHVSGNNRWLIISGIAVLLAAGIDSTILAKSYANPEVFTEYVIATNPSCAMAYNNRGAWKGVSKNDPQGAIADFNEAIRLSPEYSSALNNRAFAYKNTGRLSEAVADFTEAMKYSAASEVEYFNRGSLLYQLGKIDDAESDFKKALAIKPDYVHAINARGLIKNTHGDRAGAIADFSEAIRLNPQLAEAYCNRGMTYSDLHRYDEARADFESAIRSQPDMTIAYANLSTLLEAAGKNEEALRVLTNAIEKNPGSTAAFITRGLLRHRCKQFSAALADFNAAIRLTPNSFAAFINRGMTQESLGDFQKALEDFSEAIRLNPASSLGYKNRGKIHLKMNNVKSACEDLERASAMGDSEAGSLLRQYRP